MRKIWAVKAEVIEMINEAAVNTFPKEFIAALRAEEGVITELLLLPGSITGDSFSQLQLWNLPIDYSVAGSVHSHPGYSNRPSSQDLIFFSHFGMVHIITCLPFDDSSWKAYNLSGERIELQVLLR
jgi:proteasome lid subunit RPN8/RPN11